MDAPRRHPAGVRPREIRLRAAVAHHVQRRWPGLLGYGRTDRGRAAIRAPLRPVHGGPGLEQDADERPAAAALGGAVDYLALTMMIVSLGGLYVSLFRAW